MEVLYVVLSLCLGSHVTFGHPDGAPDSVCGSMTPSHGEGVVAQEIDSPYTIDIGDVTTFEKDKPVTVKITGKAFSGFLLQLRKKDQETPLGTWSDAPSGTKLMKCTTDNSAVTHSTAYDKDNSMEFTWNPPDSANGDYEFVATVAENEETFWVKIKSSTLKADYGNDGNGSSAIFLGTATVSLLLVALAALLFI